MCENLNQCLSSNVVEEHDIISSYTRLLEQESEDDLLTRALEESNKLFELEKLARSQDVFHANQASTSILHTVDYRYPSPCRTSAETAHNPPVRDELPKTVLNNTTHAHITDDKSPPNQGIWCEDRDELFLGVEIDGSLRSSSNAVIPGHAQGTDLRVAKHPSNSSTTPQAPNTPTISNHQTSIKVNQTKTFLESKSNPGHGSEYNNIILIDSDSDLEENLFDQLPPELYAQEGEQFPREERETLLALKNNVRPSSPSEAGDLYDGKGAGGFEMSAGAYWMYPTNYPIRQYQLNIVKTALFHNTLVCLPTGLGKTFIAAVVMFNFYRWYPLGKILFLAPTKPLVHQQIDSCYRVTGISEEDTVELTGHMKAEQRDIAWKQKRLFFATPQVVSNDLARGTCDARSVRCVVIDEAHKALGQQSYCQVIKSLHMSSSDFRVLALSATPGRDMAAIQKVLNNLRISKLELRSENSLDVAPYTQDRSIETVVVPLGERLSQIKDKYLSIVDVYVRRLQNYGVLSHPTSSLGKFRLILIREQFRKSKAKTMSKQTVNIVESDFAIAMTLYHALELLCIHGVRSFATFLDEKLNDKQSNLLKSRLMHNPSFISLLDEVKQQLMPIDVQEQDPDVSFSVLNRSEREQYICTHPKMEKLEEVVLAHFQSCKNEGVHTRVMVFAEYRETVVEICHILQQYHPLVKPMKFIGQFRQGKGGFSQKQQIEVMKKFCNGGYNTLVSTCVGEEGLDIGEVDLIVCFDSSSSSVRTKQRIGRTGRKRAGRVVFLLTQGKEYEKFKKSMYQGRGIDEKLLDPKLLAKYLHPDSPSMIPQGVKPECIKLHMTIKPKETPEEQKPKKNQDLRLFMTKRSSGGGSKLRRSMEASTCYSTPEELSEFWEGSVPTFGKLPHIDMFWDRSETFNAVSDDFEVDPDKSQVDLSSWLDCQIDLQPTFIVEHSNETENLVALLRRAEEKRSRLIPLTQTARLASQVDTNLFWHRGRGKGRGRWKGRSKGKDVRKGKMKGIQTTLKLGGNKTAGNKNLLNEVQEKDKNSINKATPNSSDFEANMPQHCFKTNEDRCPAAEDVVIMEEEPDCEILYGISTEDRKLIREILSNIGETIRNERQQRKPLFLNFPTVDKIFSANKNENREQRTINFNRKSYPYDINVVMSKGAFEHVDLDVLFSEVSFPKVINYSDNRIILDEPICRAPICDEFINVDNRRSDETEVNKSANFIATPQFDLMLGDLLFEDEEIAEIDDDVYVMKTVAHEDNPISSEKPREIEFEKLVPNISIEENTKIQSHSDCIHGASSTSVINDGGKDMSASKPLKNLRPILFSPAMMRAGMETEELRGTSPIRCQRSEVTEFTSPTNKFIPPENEPAMSPVLGLQRNSKKSFGFSSSTPKLSRKGLFSRFDRTLMNKYEHDSSRLAPRANSCHNMSLASSLKIKPLNVSPSYTSLPKELLGTTKSHDSIDKTPDKGTLINMTTSSSMHPPIISANLGVESPHFVSTRTKPNFDLFGFDLDKLSEGFEENLDSEEYFNKGDEENGEKNIKRPTVDSANVLDEKVERKEDHNHDILWNDSDDIFDGLDEVILAPRQNTTSEVVNPLDDSAEDKAPIKFTSKEDLFNRLGIHPRISEGTDSESSSVEEAVEKESLEKSGLHEELNMSNLVSNVKINGDQNYKIDSLFENNNITNNKSVHKLSSDEDDASVIQQPRKKKCLLLNSSDEILGEPSHIIGEETEDDDFLSQSILKFKPLLKNINLEKSAIGSVKNSKKQRKVDSKKNPCPFLENEAEVTMDLAQASTDEDSSELDCYDSSFVNDSGNDEGSENELQKKFVHSIIRNPAIGKPALWKRPRSQRQLAFKDLFSQAESEFESSYINDSFCVKGDEASGSEMSDLSELEQAEAILNTKRKGDMKIPKRVYKNVNSKKRRRIIVMEESENEEDNSNVRNKVSLCDRIPDLRPHVSPNTQLTKTSREDVGNTHVTEKNTSPMRHLCFDFIAEEIKQRLKGALSSEDDGNGWLSKSSKLRKGGNGCFSKLSETNNKCIDIKKSESLGKKVSCSSTLISKDANKGIGSKDSEKEPMIDFSLNNIEWSDEDFDLGSLSKKSAPNRNVSVLTSEAQNNHDLLSPFDSTKVAGVSNITKLLLTSPQNDVDSLTAQRELKQSSLPVRPKRLEFECCVLVSSSQITCAQEVVVGLRSMYDFEVKVLPMKEADYIVSWRVGVVRKTMTEFLQVPLKQHNKQILQLLRLQFQCPVLIIENDAKHPLPTSNNRTIWTPQGAFDISALSMATHIRSLYSESKADTARLLASLGEREWNAGHAITLLDQRGMRDIDNKQLVYSNLPGVNSALSLKIYKMYPKISDFILSVRTIKDIQNVTQMDKSAAQRLCEALHGRPRLP